MLEGDELLELAQETGYRLCYTPKNLKEKEEGSSSVFSAAWDSNPQFYRLFVCLQSGELKVIDFLESKSSSYQIRFQHYISNVAEIHKASDKLIKLHYDKFATIPGKESEFIFLLGVSNSILHTKLPDMISDDVLTNMQWSSYHFGSPVLELASHTTRITSVSVSPNGKYLASGDESGNVKVLLLQTKTNMQQVLTDEFQRINNQKQSDSSNIVQQVNQIQRNTNKNYLLKYDKTESLHNGPVFALQWLYPQSVTSFNSSNGLLTGSIDRVIRLWNVTYSVAHGIEMRPMMIFDTFSSHVLSLQTFSSSAFAEQQSQQQQTSPLNTANLASNRELSDKTNNNNNTGEETISVTSSQAVVNAMIHYSYLFAGTHLGTLHVWKLLDSELKTLYEKRVNPNNHNHNGSKENTDLYDNGKRLIAVIQVFDTPLIHLSTGNMISSLVHLHNSFNGNLLLSVSDNNGRVKIYGTEYNLDEDENDEKHSKFLLKSAANLENERNPEDEDDEENEVLKLEDNYQIQKIKASFEKEFRHSYLSNHDSPFKNRRENNYSDSNPLRLGSPTREYREQEQDDDQNNNLEEKFSPYKEEYFEFPIVANQFSKNVHQKPELVIITMNGNIRLYNDIQESQFNKHTQLHVSVPLQKALKPANIRTTPRVSSIDSPEKLKQRLLSSSPSKRGNETETLDDEMDQFSARFRGIAAEGEGERGGGGENHSYLTRTPSKLTTDNNDASSFLNPEMKEMYEKKKNKMDKTKLKSNDSSNTTGSNQEKEGVVTSPSKKSSKTDRKNEFETTSESASPKKFIKNVTIKENFESKEGSNTSSNNKTSKRGAGRSSLLQQSDELEPKPRFQSPPKPILLNNNNNNRRESISHSSSAATGPARRVSLLEDMQQQQHTQQMLRRNSTQDVLSRRGSMMSMKSTDLLSEKDYLDEELFSKYSIEKSPYLNNEFSIPALQSTKVSAKTLFSIPSMFFHLYYFLCSNNYRFLKSKSKGNIPISLKT
jgi:hypothetical protein